MTERFIPTVSQIRECRSLVLDYVNSVYPAGLPESELLDVMLSLDEPVSNDYIVRDLGYLRDRGLIESEIREHPVRKVKVKRWRLTARGVTFIEHGKPWAEVEAL